MQAHPTIYRNVSRWLLTGFCLALLAPLAVCADDPAADPATAKMMQAMEELGKPGPEHARLAERAGDWKATTTMFGPGPDAGTTYVGSAHCELLYGGRFLQQTFHGQWMGKPFTGTEISGYDRFKNKFVDTWFDDAGTGILMFEGTADAATGVVTQTGRCASPMGMMNYKTTTTPVADGKYEFTMFMVNEEGHEEKHMHILYERQ